MVKRIFLYLIKGYQYLISPVTPPSCRFHPSCSNYAIAAIDKYGPVRGSLLALWRVLKCHPFHRGGYDPLR